MQYIKYRALGVETLVGVEIIEFLTLQASEKFENKSTYMYVIFGGNCV